MPAAAIRQASRTGATRGDAASPRPSCGSRRPSGRDSLSAYLLGNMRNQAAGPPACTVMDERQSQAPDGTETVLHAPLRGP
jgi:hypothetical protein